MGTHQIPHSHIPTKPLLSHCSLVTWPAAPYLPAMPAPDRAPLHTWLHHWQDEFDAAYLHDVLAAPGSDPKRKATYGKLAAVERRHTELWARLLGENGHAVPIGGATPSLKGRGMGGRGGRFGPRHLPPPVVGRGGAGGEGEKERPRSSGAGGRARGGR